MSFSLSEINEANNECQNAVDDSEITVLSHDHQLIYIPPNAMTQPSSDRYTVLAKEPQLTDIHVSIKSNGTTVSVDSVDEKRRPPQQEEEPQTTTNASIYDKFELTDEVEWGPRKGEQGYDKDQELAPKPRRVTPDSCGCQPIGLSYMDTCFVIKDESMAKACLDDSCVLYATFEECGSNCEALHTCGNNRLQRKKFCKVETFDAGLKGKGLRLAEDGTCNKGDIIGEYVGQAINESHLSRRFRKYERDRRLYIMALGDGVFLDARNKGGLARYINHSCEPNCRVERWKVKGIVRAAVVSLRKILHLIINGNGNEDTHQRFVIAVQLHVEGH
jgi:SET domain